LHAKVVPKHSCGIVFEGAEGKIANLTFRTSVDHDSWHHSVIGRAHVVCQLGASIHWAHLSD